jgi:hypothetical protein
MITPAADHQPSPQGEPVSPVRTALLLLALSAALVLAGLQHWDSPWPYWSSQFEAAAILGVAALVAWRGSRSNQGWNRVNPHQTNGQEAEPDET